MHSALYEGTIHHRRFALRPDAFRHRVAMAYIDLDELPWLLGGRLAGSRGLVRFDRGDYLGDPALPLADEVRQVAAERLGTAPAGPVRLLTHLRSFGHCFNPVSFYYCFDADGELGAIVAEVTNTPWGERHAYVLPRTSESPVLTGQTDKALHVSPFMGMEQRYEWRAPAPGRTLSVRIASREATEPSFEATLSLCRRELTRRSLADVTIRYPASTLRVLALIYGHALKLRLGGIRPFPHPQAAA
ncbi:MAG: DUF1365 domain-containing protein [Solirubrobacteraceae bacterium]